MTRLWRLIRSWLVPALGLLVVVTGFLPWYGARWQITTINPPSRSYGTDYLSAWQASTRWTVAIAMSAAAAAVWLLSRATLHRVPLVLRAGLALVPCAAVVLAMDQL